MSIEPAIRTILATDPTVTAIVDDRIWLGVRPQDERRAGIVIQLITSNFMQTLDDHAGYTTGTVQLSILAPTYREAKELTDTTIEAIDQYTGTAAGLQVDWIIVDTVSDIQSAPIEGKAVPTLGVAIECSFMHKRQ